MTDNKPNINVTRFVDYLFNEYPKNKGLAARLRRADNPATEYQSWGVLAQFNVELTIDAQRLPCCLIAASIAKSDSKSNGSLSLGQAIALCYPEEKVDKKSNQAEMRLRRLLTCDDVVEVCRTLRSLLTLIQSRVDAPLDYVRLLNQLLTFDRLPIKAKTEWATGFYRSAENADDELSDATVAEVTL